MLFPADTRLGMALQGALHREDEATVKSDIESIEIPIGIGIVNANEGRDSGCRGVGIGVLSVATKGSKIECGGKGEEETLGGLFHTGGIGLGNSMKARRCSGGAIAAVTRPALTAVFNFILPVWVEDNGVFGGYNRGSKHAKFMELVKLLGFGSFPKWPVVKITKLAASKTSQSSFGSSHTFGLDGVYE
jgi:hypothetical protein